MMMYVMQGMQIFVPRAYCSMSPNLARRMYPKYSGPSQGSVVSAKISPGAQLASADPEKDDCQGDEVPFVEKHFAVNDVVGKNSHCLDNSPCSQEKTSSTSTINLQVDCFTTSSTQIYIESEDEGEDAILSREDAEESKVLGYARTYLLPVVL